MLKLAIPASQSALSKAASAVGPIATPARHVSSARPRPTISAILAKRHSYSNRNHFDPRGMTARANRIRNGAPPSNPSRSVGSLLATIPAAHASSIAALLVESQSCKTLDPAIGHAARPK